MADILLRGVPVRLEVPSARLSGVQCGIDDPAPALARAHVRVQRREVPSARDFTAEVADALRLLGAGCKVVALTGIPAEIVELIGIAGRVDEFVIAAPDHHDRRDGAFGKVLAERLVVAFAPLDMRQQAAPVHRIRE